MPVAEGGNARVRDATERKDPARLDEARRPRGPWPVSPVAKRPPRRRRRTARATSFDRTGSRPPPALARGRAHALPPGSRRRPPPHRQRSRLARSPRRDTPADRWGSPLARPARSAVRPPPLDVLRSSRNHSGCMSPTSLWRFTSRRYPCRMYAGASAVRKSSRRGAKTSITSQSVGNHASCSTPPGMTPMSPALHTRRSVPIRMSMDRT